MRKIESMPDGGRKITNLGTGEVTYKGIRDTPNTQTTLDTSVYPPTVKPTIVPEDENPEDQN